MALQNLHARDTLELGENGAGGAAEAEEEEEEADELLEQRANINMVAHAMEIDKEREEFHNANSIKEENILYTQPGGPVQKGESANNEQSKKVDMTELWDCCAACCF
jgi:hypothetical protein